MSPILRFWDQFRTSWSVFVRGIIRQSPENAWFSAFAGLLLLFLAAGNLSRAEDVTASSGWATSVAAITFGLSGLTLIAAAVQALWTWRRGTSHGQSSTNRQPHTPPETRTSGFWLYCAFLSLLFVIMAIGYMKGAIILSGGRTGPVHEVRTDPRQGIVLLAVGILTTVLCLLNASRTRRPF